MKGDDTKMLKRRQFLIFGSILGLSPYIEAKEIRTFEKEFDKVKQTISAVQAHMFPSHSKLPSASSMHVTTFLFDTIKHKSYDRDIRAFVIEGAKELQSREKGRFFAMTEKEKERALRAYEETEYGSTWLSRIMTLTMEGMFCDPIYGSNVQEVGWKTLGSFGGQPRPKKRYLDV
jgi:hypothetical protein